jgi:hypothetical protein
MEKVSAVDVVSAFLEENGYKFLHPLIRKNHSPVAGEYFILTQSSIHKEGGLSHLQVMCKHGRWDLCLAIFNNGLISINRDLLAVGTTDKIGPPMQQAINLCNPKSLEVLKRLL